MNDRCTNFKFNEKSDSVLELIKLNCDSCEHNKNECGIYQAYIGAKNYACSFSMEVKEQ